MNKDIETREKKLEERLERIKDLEQEIIERERKIKQKESEKKQLLLRLPTGLWNEVSEWAEADFRSINGQIEFILSDAVKKRKNSQKQK